MATPVIALATRNDAAPAAPAVVQAQPGSSDDEPVAVRHPLVLNTAGSVAGTVVVDDKGLTLYHFSGDKPGHSRCEGTCATSFIPVRSYGGKPSARSPIAMSRVGSSIRPDGSYQVTFGALPLYRYKGDTKPGDAKGNGVHAFGGTWTAATPGGK